MITIVTVVILIITIDCHILPGCFAFHRLCVCSVCSCCTMLYTGQEHHQHELYENFRSYFPGGEVRLPYTVATLLRRYRHVDVTLFLHRRYTVRHSSSNS
jgi:hypothetical protein